MATIPEIADESAAKHAGRSRNEDPHGPFRPGTIADPRRGMDLRLVNVATRALQESNH